MASSQAPYDPCGCDGRGQLTVPLQCREAKQQRPSVPPRPPHPPPTTTPPNLAALPAPQVRLANTKIILFAIFLLHNICMDFNVPLPDIEEGDRFRPLDRTRHAAPLSPHALPPAARSSPRTH